MTQLGVFEPFTQRRASTMDLAEGPKEYEGTTGSIATVLLPAELQRAEGVAKFEKALVMVEPATMPFESRDLTEPLHVCEWGGISALHIDVGSIGILEFPPALPGAFGLSVSFDSCKVAPEHLITTSNPEDQQLTAALERAPETPATAVARARALLAAAHGLGMHADRVAVTRSSCVAVTLMRGRRYAIFECDTDGDVVLTLTDRTLEGEADTYVIEQGQEKAHLEKAAHFLEG